ncbi:MAG TPA: hypothetical protein VJ792_02290 [Candidatus Nitrosotalea sp.]|nr:hypothetical protein [Candidatus Nitrosotalea sp.]
MPKKEKWDYVGDDASRSSIYLSDKTWDQIDHYKEQNGIRSRNMAVNNIITEHLAEDEKNESVNNLSLPCICPRSNFENPLQPSPVTEYLGFCTGPDDVSYANDNNTKNNVNPPPIEVPFLYLHNIGITSAKEVHLKIYDNYGKKLDDVDRFALSVDESHRTRVNLDKTNAGRIKGTYQDVTGKSRELDTSFHYPL